VWVYRGDVIPERTTPREIPAATGAGAPTGGA
jgi:hypothetical protein